MLLALRDDKGTLESKASMYQYALGGAILTELAMNEVIRIRSDKKMLVDHVSSRHIGDPILDECLELVSSAKRRRRARDWVERFGTLKRLRQLIRDIRDLRRLAQLTRKRRHLVVAPHLVVETEFLDEFAVSIARNADNAAGSAAGEKKRQRD